MRARRSIACVIGICAVGLGCSSSSSQRTLGGGGDGGQNGNSGGLAGTSSTSGGSASGMVNVGGFSAAIVAQAAIGLLISAHLGYRVALLPLLALMAMGALQTLRHPVTLA